MAGRPSPAPRLSPDQFPAGGRCQVALQPLAQCSHQGHHPRCHIICNALILPEINHSFQSGCRPVQKQGSKAAVVAQCTFGQGGSRRSEQGSVGKQGS